MKKTLLFAFQEFFIKFFFTFCERRYQDTIGIGTPVAEHSTNSVFPTSTLSTSSGKEVKLGSAEKHKNKIKPSLYSPYYSESCNEWRGPSPRLSAWATQLRRNVAAVASRWRHCADLTGPGIEPQISRTESVRLATELTAGAEKNLRDLK